MAKKLYSVHEITAMLNEQMATYEIDYRFTEDRVRARLRYAQSKGEVTPKSMPYDKRASFYSASDFEYLKRAWIGAEGGMPMGYDGTEPRESQEVEVRKANTKDAMAILHMSALDEDHIAVYVPQLASLLRGSREQSFVAFATDGQLIGWAHAAYSVPESLIRGQSTGMLFLMLAAARPDAALAATLLMQVTLEWFSAPPVQAVLVHLPNALNDLAEMLGSSGWERDDGEQLLRHHMAPESATAPESVLEPEPGE